MKQIKAYFASWDLGRWFKLILAITLGVAYIFGSGTIFLFGSLFLAVQAILNIGCGCATGNCSTAAKKDENKVSYKFEEYKAKK
ncbi:MAG: hypothetical protein H6Q18_423 [Bacteroidetes bacterium]|nr:hypothetical protein [Bacteroidota bacterium]